MPIKFRNKFGPTACVFIENIIDGMLDWVRVIDKDNTVIFVNKSMSEALGEDIIGKKCFEALGRDKPCENCISRQGSPMFGHCKEETINGRTFSVSSSPLRSEEDDSFEAVVEVLHDITNLKTLSMELTKQNNRLKEDLLMAKSLQCSLLPKSQLSTDKFEFSYIYRPCETLGGDFLDIFKIDDEHTGIYIADVSGHGLVASMLTMFLRAAVDKKSLSPSQVLTNLNIDFNKNGFTDDLYIAVFYGILDTANNTFTYSNAGLNVCPIMYSKDDFQILRASGIPISTWLESPGYTEVTIKIKPQDKLFFSTDGIIEIRNKYNELFGEERVIDHLKQSETPPYQTLQSLIAKAFLFSESDNQSDIIDDITVALIEIK